MIREQHVAARRRLIAKLRLHSKAVTWLGMTLATAGVAVIAFPLFGPLVVGAVAGWVLWLLGAAMLFVSLFTGSEKTSFGAVLTSLAAIGGGAFLLFNPTAGALATTFLVAAVLIVDGAFELALALDLRPVAAWRWVLASSIASALAGIVLASGAEASRSILPVLLGLALSSSGLALLALGRTRRARATGVGSAQLGVARTSPNTPST